jgi:hypothetical protein
MDIPFAVALFRVSGPAVKSAKGEGAPRQWNQKLARIALRFARFP